MILSNKQNIFNGLNYQPSQDIQSAYKNPFSKVKLIEQNMLCSDPAKKNTQTSGQVCQESKQYREMLLSMQRRFKLEILKEKQLFSMMETKLKQQIEFLAGQNQTLKQQNKQLTKKIKKDNIHSEIEPINLDQNNQLIISQITNLRSMLTSLQKEHQNCISNKKELIDAKQTLSIKIAILENENKQLQSQSRELKRKAQTISQLETQNQIFKTEVHSLRKQVVALRKSNQDQEKQFNEQLSTLQKAIQEIQSKTIFPTNSQKIFSFQESKFKQDNKQKDIVNYPNRSHTKINHRPYSDRHTDVSIVSENNRYSQDSLCKSSFGDSDCDYYQKENSKRKQMVNQLFKKNLYILNQNNSIASARLGNVDLQGKNNMKFKQQSCLRTQRNIDHSQKLIFPSFSKNLMNPVLKPKALNRAYKYL